MDPDAGGLKQPLDEGQCIMAERLHPRAIPQRAHGFGRNNYLILRIWRWMVGLLEIEPFHQWQSARQKQNLHHRA